MSENKREREKKREAKEEEEKGTIEWGSGSCQLVLLRLAKLQGSKNRPGFSSDDAPSGPDA